MYLTSESAIILVNAQLARLSEKFSTTWVELHVRMGGPSSLSVTLEG